MLNTRRNWMISAAVFVAVGSLCSVAFAEMQPKNAAADLKSKKSGLYFVVGASDRTDTEVATFAAGCFWGVEEYFRKLPGVTATAVGYVGGTTKNPTYREVCDDDKTGHAEGVQVEFDPQKITYATLVDEFFLLHDPTTMNRQGPDVGTQYRSAIFFHSDIQKKIAQAAKEKLQKSGELDAPVVTEIVAAPTFWHAEGYHQQYVEKGGYASCHPRKRPKH
jgi:peptide-methionine (S)-S-oxide reductase